MPKETNADKVRDDFIKEITEALEAIRSGLTSDELDAYEDALAQVAESELGVTFCKPRGLDTPEDADC